MFNTASLRLHSILCFFLQTVFVLILNVYDLIFSVQIFISNTLKEQPLLCDILQRIFKVGRRMYWQDAEWVVAHFFYISLVLECMIILFSNFQNCIKFCYQFLKHSTYAQMENFLFFLAVGEFFLRLGVIYNFVQY